MLRTEFEGDGAKRAKTLSSGVSQSNSPSPIPYFSVPNIPASNDPDPELPRPQSSELQQLYSQYIESRKLHIIHINSFIQHLLLYR